MRRTSCNEWALKYWLSERPTTS